MLIKVELVVKSDAEVFCRRFAICGQWTEVLEDAGGDLIGGENQNFLELGKYTSVEVE